MPRLPQPGGDAGNWGEILNEFLVQSLTDDGNLKPNTVSSTQLQDSSVTTAKLNDDAVTAAKIAPGAVTKATVGLTNVDNTADADKPISSATQAALNSKADASSLAAKQDKTTLDIDTATLVGNDASATSVAVDAKIEEAAEIQMAGIERGYAERITTYTTTSAAYPGVALPGLSVTVVGQGRPVDIEVSIANAYHSVVNTAVTAIIVINGTPLSPLSSLGSVYSPETDAGPALVVRRRSILVAGTSYTFTVNIYGGAVGTSTLVAASYAPMYLSVVSR